MVNTVADNKSNYTVEEYSHAVLARQLQIKIGRPSTKDFIRIVTSNQLPNCPITRADILAAEHIFGPDVGSLKGKTTRKAPPRVHHQVDPLPPVVMMRYRDVALCADVMFVNGIPFLVTVSRNIHFGTVEAIPNRKKDTLLKSIRSVLKIYRRAGFRVQYAYMDIEFVDLKIDLMDDQVTLNEAGEDEHVGDVERYICTTKERMHATYNMLPFENILPRLVIEMAKSSVFWRNAFPHRLRVSRDLSP